MPEAARLALPGASAHPADPGALAAEGTHAGAYMSLQKTLLDPVLRCRHCVFLPPPSPDSGHKPCLPCPTSAPACFAAPFSVGTPATAPAACAACCDHWTFSRRMCTQYQYTVPWHMGCRMEVERRDFGEASPIPAALVHAFPALLHKSSTCRSDAMAVRAM